MLSDSKKTYLHRNFLYQRKLVHLTHRPWLQKCLHWIVSISIWKLVYCILKTTKTISSLLDKLQFLVFPNSLPAKKKKKKKKNWRRLFSWNSIWPVFFFVFHFSAVWGRRNYLSLSNIWNTLATNLVPRASFLFF